MWRRGHQNGRDTDDAASEEPLDEELIALRSILDPAAFAPLYRRYLPEILALCTRRLGNRSDAEDATAEVFRKAWAKRDTFHGGSFRKWLYTIAINTLRDHADRPAPPVAGSLAAPSAAPLPGDRISPRVASQDTPPRPTDSPDPGLDDGPIHAR